MRRGTTESRPYTPVNNPQATPTSRVPQTRLPRRHDHPHLRPIPRPSTHVNPAEPE